jgi:hypothetical protein
MDRLLHGSRPDDLGGHSVPDARGGAARPVSSSTCCARIGRSGAQLVGNGDEQLDAVGVERPVGAAA